MDVKHLLDEHVSVRYSQVPPKLIPGRREDYLIKIETFSVDFDIELFHIIEDVAKKVGIPKVTLGGALSRIYLELWKRKQKS